jgi:Cytochrome oxidase assembly factor
MEYNLKQKNSNLILYIFILVIAMLALSFASVPLYDLFCRVTGYAGTTQKSNIAPGSRVNANLFNVRFDAKI